MKDKHDVLTVREVLDSGIVKVAICGRIRSGKDTVGELLVIKYGFTRFAYGDGIKQLIGDLFPDELAKGKPRKLLQDVGQKMREVDPDIWVRRVEREVLASGASKVVITDLRQPNEYEALRKSGYFIIKLKVDDMTQLERVERAGDKYNDKDFLHDTESHVDGFEAHATIYNNGTVQDLQDAVEYVLYPLLKGVAK